MHSVNAPNDIPPIPAASLAAPPAHPQFRGSAPIVHTLLRGDERTGVSVIEIHRDKWDAGALLLQRETPIGPREGCTRWEAGGDSFYPAAFET